jgi:hypothetical protein
MFFSSRCSNRTVVLAIPVSTVPISPLTHELGGQHGEEAKDESEGGSEKDGAQDEAQKEEGVRHRRLDSRRLHRMSVTASNGPARADERTAERDRHRHAGPSRRQGRRRERKLKLAALSRKGRAVEIEGRKSRLRSPAGLSTAGHALLESRRRPRFFCSQAFQDVGQLRVHLEDLHSTTATQPSSLIVFASCRVRLPE